MKTKETVNKGITRYLTKDGKEITEEEHRKLREPGDKSQKKETKTTKDKD